MIYDFDIDKIQDYLQTLAQRNVDVAHNANGNKSFARFQSNSQMAEIKKAAGKNIAVVSAINGKELAIKMIKHSGEKLYCALLCMPP